MGYAALSELDRLGVRVKPQRGDAPWVGHVLSQWCSSFGFEKHWHEAQRWAERMSALPLHARRGDVHASGPQADAHRVLPTAGLLDDSRLGRGMTDAATVAAAGYAAMRAGRATVMPGLGTKAMKAAVALSPSKRLTGLVSGYFVTRRKIPIGRTGGRQAAAATSRRRPRGSPRGDAGRGGLEIRG